jgi:hypothetical protein
MTWSQLFRSDLYRLRTENQRLQLEVQRLKAENQAAKEWEERYYRNEREIIEKYFADQRRRDQERLERLMLKGEE